MSPEAPASLLREALARHGFVHVTLRGASMGRALPDGTTVRIEPTPCLCMGQIIAVQRGERLLVHRLVWRHGARLWLQGDVMPATEGPIAVSDVLGRVVLVPRRRAVALRAVGRAWWLELRERFRASRAR